MTLISYRQFKASKPGERQVLIDALTEKLLPTFEKDPDILKFVIGIPKATENDELSVFTIEE